MKKDKFHHIFIRDNWTCQYCGLDASKDFNIFWYANLNIDHIKPKSKGGGDDDNNLVVACRACNLYKSNNDCNSLSEGKLTVDAKRKESQQWFNYYVLKKQRKSD